MAILSRGERFKDARIVHNKNGKQTMKTVEIATGVSASLIKDLEDDNSSRSVGYEKVTVLAKHYGVSSDWLLCLSNDPAPKPCAVDELGLSPQIIGTIKYWKSINDESHSDSLDGLLMFLEYTLNSGIFEMISHFSRRIQCEENTDNSYFVKEFGSTSDNENPDCNYDTSIGSILSYQLIQMHPNARGRIQVKFGSEILESEFNEICSWLRRYLEELTGYKEYLDNRK